MNAQTPSLAPLHLVTVLKTRANTSNYAARLQPLKSHTHSLAQLIAKPKPKSKTPQKTMCSSASVSLVNHNGPGSSAASTISSIVKPEGGATGRTKCIECDGYECCCIPIPCTVM